MWWLAGGEALYSFTIKACLLGFVGPDVCVRGVFGDGEFWKKFVKFGPGVLLFKMWWCYLPMGCFDTSLKEKEDDE